MRSWQQHGSSSSVESFESRTSQIPTSATTPSAGLSRARRSTSWTTRSATTAKGAGCGSSMTSKASTSPFLPVAGTGCGTGPHLTAGSTAASGWTSSWPASERSSMAATRRPWWRWGRSCSTASHQGWLATARAELGSSTRGLQRTRALATARAELGSAVQILDRREKDTTELVRLGERFGERLLAEITEEMLCQERKHVRSLAKRILHQLEDGPLTPSELADRLDAEISEISRAERLLRDDGRVVRERDSTGQQWHVLALPEPDHAEAADVAMTPGRP